MRLVKDKYGDSRVVTRFLWFPVIIGREMRWLERATIRQRNLSSWWWPLWCNMEFVEPAQDVLLSASLVCPTCGDRRTYELVDAHMVECLSCAQFFDVPEEVKDHMRRVLPPPPSSYQVNDRIKW